MDLSLLPSRLPKLEDETSTPLYVYSHSQIKENINSYKKAFHGRDHIIGFSLKVRY